MADIKNKVGYIVNIESAKICHVANDDLCGDPSYKVDVECTDSMNPTMKDMVIRFCREHQELNLSKVVRHSIPATNQLRLPIWAILVACPIGAIAECFYMMKFDKDGDTIDHVVKNIAVAAKALKVTANASTDMIKRWKV